MHRSTRRGGREEESSSMIVERMDAFTSNPALLVNAELLKRYQGRRVRTVVKVVVSNIGILQGESCDGKNIMVRQVVKSEEFTPFVEIIGVVGGDLSIRCEKCTNFGENFDMSNFNTLCDLANGQYQGIFI